MFDAKVIVVIFITHLLCGVIGYAAGAVRPPEKPGTE